MDWREREEIVKEYQELEKKITNLLGMWIEDQTGRIFKVAKAKGQIFLVEVNDEKKVITYRVTACDEQSEILKISASSKVGSKFQMIIQDSGSFVENEYTTEATLTEIGNELLTEDEFNYILDVKMDIHSWLKEEIQHKVKVEIISDSDSDKKELS